MEMRKNVTVKRIIGMLACVAAGLMFLPAPVVADTPEFKESLVPFPPAVAGWTAFGTSIKFSADMTHMAYVASRDKKFAVVRDGKIGPLFDAIGQDTPIFSPDGKHIVYKAKKGDKWCLVVDNKEQARQYEGVSVPMFSPDSAHMLYAGKKGEKQCLVVDDREVGCYDSIMQNGIKFGHNSARWAVVVIKNKQQVVVVDGQEGAAYEKVNLLLFSPDDRRLAYAASRAEKWMMVVDGKEGASWKSISAYAFSPDSQHLY